MPNSKKRTRTILWAVDPFHKTSDATHSAAWALRALLRGMPRDTRVLPVYLWGATAPEVMPDLSHWSARGVREDAEGRVASITERIRLPNLEPLHMPNKPCLGIRDGVRTLLSIAKKEQAQLIVVSTQGKKGLKRLALGSFAETLVLHSEIPVFTVHPNWRRTPELKQILFPTDFSQESKQAFDQLVDFAKTRGARITLFHKVVMPYFPSLDFPFAAARAIDEGFRAEVESSRELALGWSEEARRKGVQVRVDVDRTGRGGVAETAVKKARKLKAMIALVAQSQPLKVSVLGSVTRQIMRESAQPVWVLRPAGVTASARRLEGNWRKPPLFAIQPEDDVEAGIRGTTRAL